jgi:tRNA(Ile)-lysidine synthase
MLNFFEKEIAKNKLLSKGEGIVVAVSGGADSMVLLDLLFQLSKSFKLKLTVAHVNHNLRGKKSDADENLVRWAAKKLGVSFRAVRWKPPARGNIQDLARRFRYDFLKSVACEAGACAIATAHNQDDQAETLLLHLIRGSGIKGMSGMEPATREEVRIVRPLLAFSRYQIEGYAKKRKIRFARDESNNKLKYTRNFIRHKVLPVLESINPCVRESLAGAAKVLKDCSTALDEVAQAFAKEFLRTGKEKIAWDRGPFLKLPGAIRRHVLIHAYERLKGDRINLNSDQIEHMETISEGHEPKARYMLPGRIEFHRTGNLIIIQRINS